MNRLDTVFAMEKPLLNIFITAGYPKIDSLPKLAAGLFKKGVDVIEVGMPYSDPLADGPIIQNASAIAIENGITIAMIFEQVKQIRALESTSPILLMGYFNQVLQIGVESFLKQCQQVGVDGLIIPDLPYDVYMEHYQSLFEEYKIAISFLVTPQTADERIRALDNACSGFLYIVSDNSLTGSKSDGFNEVQLAYFKRIKQLNLKSATMIGFGISSKKMADDANKYSNGAIIGSAYLEAIRNNVEIGFIDSLTQ